ncbi:MAG: SGNH/GDSL hydrolase family protein [Planctomycetaceae bacterium]|nr:SGNH/GDSL hydrolase family protein [Planctomycetaceae bacterium]
MWKVSRRQFLAATATTAASALVVPFSWGQDNPEIQWHDVRDWGIEGKGWNDTEKYFDRLPQRAKGVVRDAVWNLSRHSAGMLARFKTDASSIWVDYTVTSANLAMPHMPATGVSGVDLYADDDDGQWKWLSVTRPNAQHMTTELISGIRPGARGYTMYLPLYNGTESLKVGIPAGASFEAIEPRMDKPIVFYGTSITHGACASRPGMPHPAILGRRLDKPVINLGFSGNGRMEREVGQFLCELDPAVYVIDCLPNMTGPEVAERAAPLVAQLRKARPETPVVLVEDRTYANTPFLPGREERHSSSRAALKDAFEHHRQAGMKKLYYLEGEKLLGEDRDDTTDGSHPNDLGFLRHADAFEPVLREAISDHGSR